MYSYNPYYERYLAHHGVKGMHWGIRRYQPYANGIPKGSKEIGKATKVKQRSESSKKKTKGTFFYSRRKKKLISQYMKESKGSNLSRKEQKKQAEQKAKNHLKKEYGDKVKLYESIEKIKKIKDTGGNILMLAAPAVFVGSTAIGLYMAKKNGYISDIKEVKDALAMQISEKAPKIAKTALTIPVATVAGAAASDVGIKIEDNIEEG